jgi:hypothetical protein
MTRQRAKDPLGKFVGDNPTTPDVNEAWKENPAAEITPNSETPEPPVAMAPEPTETPNLGAESPKSPESHEPAVIDLKTAESTAIKDKPTKESIEASIQEKLSNRLNSPEVDPFVPSSQLNNEVKEVSRDNGFPLTRGTEVGARLMAKAKRGT